ncbi:MAG: hypothetical protein IRY99_17910 [Isosphaeraceae bacterium]|nr:hypothetical protein [Isosphaeraceae bacterium]
MRRFEQDGLTAQDYLTAVIRRPDILNVKPEAIARNIQGVVDLFAADGLTADVYLKAAIKQPSLFIQTPWTLSGNITGLVQRFADEGLTDRAYLQAALKNPSLFTLSPETVEHNIRSVVERFQDDGMTAAQYLKAALRMPPLFALSPTTVIRHIDAVMDLADRRIFVPPKRRFGFEAAASPHNPAHASVIDFLLRNPGVMTWSDDNYGVREVHHLVTNGPTDRQFLSRPRHAVERELMRHLGHDDPKSPVPKDGFVAGSESPTKAQAERFVLRALIHGGFIRGATPQR